MKLSTFFLIIGLKCVLGNPLLKPILMNADMRSFPNLLLSFEQRKNSYVEDLLPDLDEFQQNAIILYSKERGYRFSRAEALSLLDSVQEVLNITFEMFIFYPEVMVLQLRRPWMFRPNFRRRDSFHQGFMEVASAALLRNAYYLVVESFSKLVAQLECDISFTAKNAFTFTLERLNAVASGHLNVVLDANTDQQSHSWVFDTLGRRHLGLHSSVSRRPPSEVIGILTEVLRLLSSFSTPSHKLRASQVFSLYVLDSLRGVESTVSEGSVRRAFQFCQRNPSECLRTTSWWFLAHLAVGEIQRIFDIGSPGGVGIYQGLAGLVAVTALCGDLGAAQIWDELGVVRLPGILRDIPAFEAVGLLPSFRVGTVEVEAIVRIVRSLYSGEELSDYLASRVGFLSSRFQQAWEQGSVSEKKAVLNTTLRLEFEDALLDLYPPPSEVGDEVSSFGDESWDISSLTSYPSTKKEEPTVKIEGPSDVGLSCWGNCGFGNM